VLPSLLDRMTHLPLRGYNVSLGIAIFAAGSRDLLYRHYPQS
jgi:hypothetical protein